MFINQELFPFPLLSHCSLLIHKRRLSQHISNHLDISFSLTFQIQYLVLRDFKFPGFFFFPYALYAFTRLMSFSWSFISYFKLYSMVILFMKSKISSLYQCNPKKKSRTSRRYILRDIARNWLYTIAKAGADQASLKFLLQGRLSGRAEWSSGQRQSYCPQGDASALFLRPLN